MSRYNHYQKLSGKKIFYRLLLATLAIITLVIFMPRGDANHYEFKLGEPWDDSPVIPEEGFPILKSEEELGREKDSLYRFYEPYFRWDRELVGSQVKLFTTNFHRMPSGTVPNYYLGYLQQKLRHVYEQGILNTEDYDRLNREHTKQVWVFQQNESNSRYVRELFSEKTAYEYLMAAVDSTKYSHSKLMKCCLDQYITPNLTYDEEKSMQQRQEVDNQLVPYKGQVQAGQKIVDRGQIVDEHIYSALLSLEAFQKSKSKSRTESLVQIAGQTVCIVVMVLLLLGYFQQFRNDYLDNPRFVSLVMTLCLAFPLMTFGLVHHGLMSVYLIPYCVLPILIRIFMDSRTAFITHTITILTCAITLQHPYEFIMTETVAGLVAILSLKQLSQRSELFRAAIFVTFATMLTYLCLDMVRGNLFVSDKFDKWTYIYLGLSGVLSLLSYLLLIPIERVFGFTSTVTLVELSNINNEVLRRLSEEAPGTFQHSMQVSNLAAEVANGLGGKSQLVRTAALYHDIGKLENPVFFTENQSGKNPHDNLPYEQSAQIIIQHVKDGLKLANKYKLPPVIQDFISTHHGKSLAKYFYVSFKNKYPDAEINESLFTYPGPNPQTLEQAILMMADAVEAVSRSLPEYTEESIIGMVDRIIDGQVSEGYFKRCPITFLEIEAAKDIFKAKLKTIYHTRIQYPELVKA